MLYSDKHLKKKSLALLLAGSLLLGNVPVYAASDSDIEFSSSESDEIETDVIPSEGDVELTIDSDDESNISTEESNASADAASSPVDFSSGENAPAFSSGNESASGMDYILGRPMTEEERQAQLAPFQNLVSFPAEEEVNSDLDIATYALYPDTYDARQDGEVTSVKNQGSLNLCWAFSLASNIETSLLSRNLGYYDLSEEHLAYFWANRVNDPLGNTPDDHIVRTRDNYHGTGNGMVASFFLSTWSGMVTEDKVPLKSSVQSYDSSLAYATDAYMEDAVFSQYDVDRTKQLLMKYSSVSAMINMLNSYYCPDTAAYSYPITPTEENHPVNHTVTLVGWNDNYSKENFNPASNVQNNGAWIVKNSYGSSWGDHGYFYLSYEDASITNLVCNTATTKPDYPNNYFYDGASVGTVTFPGNTIDGGYYISNIFKASAGNGKDEELGEIVTAVPQDNTEFQVQIYTNLTDSSTPTSGTPAYAEPVSYTQPLAGIHTIQLDTPVKIPQNTLYSVVLKIPNGSARYYVEKSTNSTSWFTAVAGIDPKQSFYSANGRRWTDAGADSSGYCFSIKAHTKTLNTSTNATPAPDPDETPIVTPVTPKPDPDETPVVTPEVTPEITPEVTPEVTPEITPDIEIPDDPEPTPTNTPAPVICRINYNKNTSLGVGAFPSSTSVQKGGTVTVANAPYCNSRFFVGWNTRADGKGTSYSPGQKVRLSQNLTLYAQWASSYTSSAKLKYRVTGKQTVTCYGTTNSKITKVSVPATIKYKGITYRVTSVWANAFKSKSRLTTVSIGNNVSVIGKNAFYNCKKLKKVTIGTGLTQINAYAFRGVKKGCTITIKSQKLKKVSSNFDKSVSKMTIRIPKKKYKAYKKLFRGRSLRLF